MYACIVRWTCLGKFDVKKHVVQRRVTKGMSERVSSSDYFPGILIQLSRDSSNKILETWGPLFWRPLYVAWSIFCASEQYLTDGSLVCRGYVVRKLKSTRTKGEVTSAPESFEYDSSP